MQKVTKALVFYNGDVSQLNSEINNNSTELLDWVQRAMKNRGLEDRHGKYRLPAKPKTALQELETNIKHAQHLVGLHALIC